MAANASFDIAEFNALANTAAIDQKVVAVQNRYSGTRELGETRGGEAILSWWRRRESNHR
jgi:hypothetical protein